MSQFEPLVTVGIALYNGSPYIQSAIRSILDGTYQNLELIVLDDGSSDNSIEIVREFSDSRIRILRNQQNQGLVNVRNQIMSQAGGDYLAWLDQDDIAMPNRLTSQINFMQKNSSVGVCGSWTVFKTLKPYGEFLTWRVKMPTKPRFIRAAIPFTNPLSFSTVTMRLERFRDHGLFFRPEFGNSLDYDMWRRAAELMDISSLPEYLGEYRIHPEQTSAGDKLFEMQQHAWKVQKEALSVTLGIHVDDHDSKHIHQQLGANELPMFTLKYLRELGNWITFLTETNSTVGSYDQRAFSAIAARQWLKSLWYARKSLTITKSIQLAATSRSVAGLHLIDLALGSKMAVDGRNSVADFREQGQN